jgi:UDP-N-acetyl-2-amino-2-deoxyglucuronate dehydrogenase
MNQGVHTVDLLIAALGRQVEVFAYTGTLAHERIEVEDVAVGVVRFDSGALGVLHATTAAYPGLSARLQVHGDRGSAVIDDDQLAFFHATAEGSEPDEKLMGTTQGTSGTTAGSDPGQLSDAHRLQYLNFLGALDGTEKLRVDLETNRQSIGVITGAYESARTGRPVSLA